MKHSKFLTLVALALSLFAAISTPGADPRKDASTLTSNVNRAVYDELPFADDADYQDAKLGFINAPPTLTICKDNLPPTDCTETPCKCAQETEVWDLEPYKKLIPTEPATQLGGQTEAPATINPSLWRNAQLNMQHGLFRVAGIDVDGTNIPNGATPTDNSYLLKVADKFGIYQVRAYDLSNITFIKGNTGWIVFDPLISPETARAALDFLHDQLGATRQVVAVIYSHSHVDHYGGAPGLFPDPAGQLQAQFIAPEGFTEHAVSENVIAGNAMGRRAIYMYGSLLARDGKGSVNAGLGQTTSTGEAGLILPTFFIAEDDESPVDAEGEPFVPSGISYDSGTGIYTIDGVEMQFQMTPGTEAPAEMNTYLPQFKGLWMAENSTNTMHNILTLRGAQVRDAYKWVSFLNETIETWGSEVQVKFQSHHWPLWATSDTDNSNIIQYLKKQRDIYKFTHDQTVRLMNNGFTGEEISELISLPGVLEENWATRGYYGTLRHNSRAVYQFYMGWYDGHPSDLNNLPPEMVAQKYMEYMSSDGTQSVLERARTEFDNATDPVTYRWVAEVMKHAVYADPTNQAKKDLLADALEQLGYQAESGPWRSVYLQGAHELRHGVPGQGGTTVATPDTIKAMPPEMVFDYLAVHLCPDSAATTTNDCTMGADAGDSNSGPLVLDMTITDRAPGTNRFTLTVENAVLNYSSGAPSSGVDVVLEITMNQLHDLLLPEEEQSGERPIEPVSGGVDYDRFNQMLDLTDNFWFNIITP